MTKATEKREKRVEENKLITALITEGLKKAEASEYGDFDTAISIKVKLLEEFRIVRRKK